MPRSAVGTDAPEWFLKAYQAATDSGSPLDVLRLQTANYLKALFVYKVEGDGWSPPWGRRGVPQQPWTTTAQKSHPTQHIVSVFKSRGSWKWRLVCL